MLTHIRPYALAPGGLLLPGLGLLLMSALVAAEAGAAPVERDEICQGYRGTALWGQCTRAVDNGCHESEPAHPRCEQWAERWRDQTDDEDPPWLIAATECVCDSVTAPLGTSGETILATLCPSGGLAAGASFQDDVLFTWVFFGEALEADFGYQVVAGIAGIDDFCSLGDGADAVTHLTLFGGEVDDCRTHLRVSCGQPVP